MVYEYSTFNQLTHAIRALPACPIEAHVILINDPYEKIANYIAICAYLNDILNMCKGSDPAIGMPLINLISQYDVQFVSTQAKLDAHITSDAPPHPDVAATTLSSTLPRLRAKRRKGAKRHKGNQHQPSGQPFEESCSYYSYDLNTRACVLTSPVNKSTKPKALSGLDTSDNPQGGYYSTMPPAEYWRSIAPAANFKGYLLSTKLKRYLSRHVSKDSVDEIINRSRRETLHNLMEASNSAAHAATLASSISTAL